MLGPMKRALLILTLLLPALVYSAQAEIYTWVDGRGVRHYSDQAAAAGARPVDLPGSQRSNAPEPSRQYDSGGNWNSNAEPVGSRLPELLRPKPQATLRSAEGVVPVAVAIGDGGLRPGEQVVYYLDGSPVAGSPTRALQFELGGVPPGSHTMSVALLYRGNEIRRSDAVMFFLETPSAATPENGASPDGRRQKPRSTTPVAPRPNVPGMPAAPRSDVRPGVRAPS